MQEAGTIHGNTLVGVGSGAEATWHFIGGYLGQWHTI